MMARRGAPRARPQGATGAVAWRVRGARAVGSATPAAVAVNHLQQAMRIAINTGCLALSVRSSSAGGLVFRISVSKSRLHAIRGGLLPTSAGNWRAKELRWHRPSSVTGGSAWT